MILRKTVPKMDRSIFQLLSRTWFLFPSLRRAYFQVSKQQRVFCTLNWKKYLLVNTQRHYSSSKLVSSDEIKNVLNEKNKTRVINDLQRMKPSKTLIESCQSEAAVLVPFCTVHNKPSLLFTLRSSSLFKHRGEVRYAVDSRHRKTNLN